MKNIETLLGKLYLGGYISAKIRDIILQEFFERGIDIEKSSTILIYNIYKKGKSKKISYKMDINQTGRSVLIDALLKNINLSKKEGDQIAMLIQIAFAKK